MYTYYETLNWNKQPDGKFFRVSYVNNQISVEACLGYQPEGWRKFSVETFELFRQAGMVEVNLEKINEERKRNNLPSV